MFVSLTGIGGALFLVVAAAVDQSAESVGGRGRWIRARWDVDVSDALAVLGPLAVTCQQPAPGRG